MRNAALAALVAVLTASPALAQTPNDDERTRPPEPSSPFDREWAIAGYATGHAGSYLAGGLGGRVRWEPFDSFGLEAYLEATLVDWPGALRHDYPNGFNVYVPIRLGDVRVRPFLGFCDILSFIEPSEAHAPRADDILFGAHAGAGVEVALHSMWSVFADVQANFYAGHDRTAGQWTGGVDEDLSFFWNVQLNLGVQLHLGQR